MGNELQPSKRKTRQPSWLQSQEGITKDEQDLQAQIAGVWIYCRGTPGGIRRRFWDVEVYQPVVEEAEVGPLIEPIAFRFVIFREGFYNHMQDASQDCDFSVGVGGVQIFDQKIHQCGNGVHCLIRRIILFAVLDGIGWWWRG